MDVIDLPKVAVIGGGYWGKNLVRNFAGLGSLYAVCDTDITKLNKYAQLYPGINITGEYNEILKDPRISGIAIATPAVEHYPMVKAALESGKDVLVEKPLALDLVQGRNLAALAAEQSRVLMVGHVLEYHPAVQELVSLVKRGCLGQIYYVYSNRLNLGKFRTEENILWSFAPHDISVIIRILGELPSEVISFGGAYINQNIADVTITDLYFSSGVKGHIFVSWLHPFKEQKLVVVGSEKMAVFDDLAQDKLTIYPHKVNWVERLPVAARGEAEIINVSNEEPLKRECMHFLECIYTREEPLTGIHNALSVLKVLSASQESLIAGSAKVGLNPWPEEIQGLVNGHTTGSRKFSQTDEGGSSNYANEGVFIHPSSVVEPGAAVGAGTHIWHFCHIMPGAILGRDCTLGQNVFVAKGVCIGSNVKIQNNVSVYEGVLLEDNVFCGPSCVFTNIKTPRSAYPRNTAADYRKTVVKKGASIGANATILSGISIGEYAMIGAGALVTGDVPDHAVVTGNPAAIQGWICKCGNIIEKKDARQIKCQSCGTDKNIEGPVNNEKSNFFKQ